MCVECLFLRSPSLAPQAYRTHSACAKRAAYPDPPVCQAGCLPVGPGCVFYYCRTWGFPSRRGRRPGRLCDFVSVYFVVTEASTGPRKRFREMIDAHGGGHRRGLPWIAPIRNSSELRGLCCLSCFGPRTCGRSVTNSSKRQGFQSGFPLLTPTMQAGQDSDGGVGVSEKMCMLQAVTVWWFWHY